MTEEQVFQQARQIVDQLAREAFLLEACEGDDRLLRRIRKLLAVEREQPAFLETPVLSFAETLAAPPTSLDRHLIENYELQELLGEGGFGLVYRAQQLRPVQRTVAVKLIKPGMDSQQVVARFSLEQQALARMNHPQIAAIYDCGQLNKGRLWFAMEYVPGRSIIEFADHFQLSLTQRIRLLIDVCNAVEHAHQRGIIHRDLKPSNLMVAGHPDHWQLKVIDFGIARAIDQTQGDQVNGDRNRLTRGQQLMGTPLYMSPEQASSESADIDIRADVYSLGSVLYEMLVGVTPFDRLSQEPSAWERVLHAIREVDPVRPSAVLQAGTEKQTAIAQSRHSSLHKLIHECQRDLDWIVMKCLEKKRENRYQTVGELRDELLRYVNGDVVLAGPPTWLSMLRKYSWKHRLALLVAAIVMGTLTLGLIVSLWQANRAYRAEAKAKIDRDLERAARLEADEQTQVSRAVTEFLTNLLQQADIANQDDPAGRDPNLTVRTVLLRAAEQIDTSFADSPSVEVVVRTALANSLRGVGSSQEAVSQAKQAVKLAEKALPNDHSHRLRAEHSLANLLTETQEIEEAIQLLQRLRKIYEDKGPLEAVNYQRITLSLAKALETAGRFVEAEPLIQQVVQKRAETFGDQHRETRGARHQLALLWSKMGKLAPAEQILRQTVDAHAKDLGETHPVTIRAIHSLATNLYLQGKRTEAEPLFLKAQTLAEDKLGGEHPITLSVWNDLANLYSDSNRNALALELYQRVLERRRQTLGEENPATLDAMNNLAVYWAEQEQPDRAIGLLESVVTLRRKISGISHEDTLMAINNLAFLHQSSGHDQRAVELYREAWTAAKDELASNHPTVVTLAANYAQSLSFVGDWSGAADVLQGNVAATRQQFGDKSIEYAAQASRLATVLCELQRWSDALPLAESAWSIRREQLPGRLAVGWSQAMFGHIQFELGQAEAGLENLAGGAQLVTECWDQVTPANQTNAVRTLQWLIDAYQKQERAADAQRWQEKLDELGVLEK